MKSSIKAWRGVAWPSKPNLATVVKHFFKENQENKLEFLSRKNFPSVRFDKELQESKNNKIFTALISNCEVSHG